MNIAESTKAYYEHSDFEDNYLFAMCEDSSSVEFQICQAINDLRFKWQFNELTNDMFAHLDITNNGAEYLTGYIFENASELYETFNSYYVGSLCVASIAYGEQEEPLQCLYNHKTGKDYTLPYLRKVFQDAGYCMNDNNYAYYDLSDTGIMIKLQSIPADIIAIAMHTV